VTMPSVEKQPDEETPKPHQEQADVKNDIIFGEQVSPLVERVKQLATKTNWALFLSFLATIFTGLSWVVSKNALRVTQTAIKADLQPYMTFPRSFEFNVITPERGNNSFKLVTYSDSVEFSNTGKSPASSVNISAQGKFYAGEGIHCDEQGTISELKNGDMLSGDTWYCGIRFEFPFPNGNAFSFKRIREMDIYITCTFSDMFSAGKTREYVAYYVCDEIGFEAELQSVEEIS